MKRILIPIIIHLMATGLFAAGFAHADTKISKKDFEQATAKGFASYVKQADKDGDGMISSPEFIEKQKSGAFFAIYKGMDRDKDGKITEQEYDTFNKGLFSNQLIIYDKNHDGKISAEEFIEKKFSQIDTNNDNHIDEQEKSTSMMVPRQHTGPQMAPKISSGFGPAHEIDDPWADDPDWGREDDEPDPGHPGCTYGDVRSGNCVCPWPDYCMPFF